jgi:hypothetical protein
MRVVREAGDLSNFFHTLFSGAIGLTRNDVLRE